MGEDYGVEDERQPKSEAVRLLGDVPTDNEQLMARSRWSRRQVATLSMMETQEEAINPNRKHRLLSTQWRRILARNNLGLDGQQRVELQTILETQSEERAAIAMTE